MESSSFDVPSGAPGALLRLFQAGLSLLCLVLPLAVVGAPESTAPLLLRPGDVLANAPLGVYKAPIGVPTSLEFASPILGVLREGAEPPQPPLHLYSSTLGVLRGPGLLSTNPNRLEIGQQGQVLVLHGIELDAADSLHVVPGDDVQVQSWAVNAEATQINVLLDLSETAEPGLRRVELLNQAGVRIPDLREGASALLFAADVPVIESVTPFALTRGTTYTLTLRGQRLRGLPFQRESDLPSPIPEVHFIPDQGLVRGSEVIVNDEGTEVEVIVEVLESASLEPRTVQVVTASAASSTVSTPSNTINIVDAAQRSLTPFVSPLLGVRRADDEIPADPTRTLYSPVLAVHRGPVITGMQPAAIIQGGVARLRLEGHYLSSMSGISVSPDVGVVLDASSLTISDTLIEIDVAIAADASIGPRRVSVQSDELKLDAPNLLQVLAPVPRIVGLTPTYLIRDGVSQTFRIQGEYLTQTHLARILPDDSGFVIEDYQVLSAELATLSMRANEQAPQGLRTLQLDGTSGPSSSEPDPYNTINVVDREQVLTPLTSPLLGVSRAIDPIPHVINPTLTSAAVVVVRGSAAEIITPYRIGRGGPSTLVVTGHGLDQVDQVVVEDDHGITVSDMQPSGDGLSISVELLVAADADLGARRLRLISSGRDLDFVPHHGSRFLVVNAAALGPVAVPETYAVHSNEALSVDAEQGVLANDFDPAGGTMFALLRRLPAHGTLSLGLDGSFAYTPELDFVGEDRFEYSAGSGELVGNAAVVTLLVNEFDRAVDDAYAVDQNAVLHVGAAQGLLANDQISSTEPVEILLLEQPGLGQIHIDNAGGFVYTPQGAEGVDTFRYRIKGDHGQSLPATVSISILHVNQPPQASDDNYAVERGQTLTVSAPGVLANDTDPDGDPLTARLLTQPQVGTLVLNANGGFTFTPPADYVGNVEFHYEAEDPDGYTDQARVLIVVNDSLAPLPDFYEMNEGEVLFVDSPEGVMANDSIISQGAVRAVLVDLPDLGTVNLAEDGAFVFTPIDGDVNGVTVFTYRLEDDSITSPPAAVTITIHPVNDPPVAEEDWYLTDENVALTVAAPGVLENDYDVDSDVFFAELFEAPEYGSVQLESDGSFTYLPAVNFRGTDTFLYVAIDDQGEVSQPGLVTIAVTQPPTATNDVYFLDINNLLVIDDPAEGLIANDHDAPENDELFAILVNPPSHGYLELAEDGTFLYQPELDFQGLDIFTYQVTDTRSLSNIATVTLAVGVTGIPRAVADAYEMYEGDELIVPASEGVLINDLDSDTPIEELQAFLVGQASIGFSTLDVTLARDGGFRVKPPRNFYGETFFTYEVFDGISVSNTAIVTIVVHPVNDGVEAEDDVFGILGNAVFTTQWPNMIHLNDTYDTAFPVAFEVVVPPTMGLLDFDNSNGRFTYTPQQDFAGSDSFVYRVYQIDTGISDTATVTLRVNRPPVAVDDFYEIDEDSEIFVDVSPLANDYDPDGDPIRFVSTSMGGGYLSISVDDASEPTETILRSGGHFYGTGTINYRITDGASDAFGKITVNVHPVPDDPVSSENNYSTERNTPLIVSAVAQGVLRNDYDPDTRPCPTCSVWAAASGPDLLPLRAILYSAPSHGTLNLFETGVFSYFPNTDFSGFDEFYYRALDGTGRYGQPTRVRIRVNSPPIAVDDFYVVEEDVELIVPANEGVLANDSDPDGDTLTARHVTSGCTPCHGQVILSSTGAFRYIPDLDYFGEDEFYYRVSDSGGGSDIGRVHITILPINDAPRPQPDTYRTDEDTLLVVPAALGVLRNDIEVDGEELVDAHVIEGVSHGTLDFQPDGAFTYLPDQDWNGRDTFRYRVYDESGLHGDADVEIFVTPVNDPPVANDDHYETYRDQVLVVSEADGVLANDFDVDGPQMLAILISPPLHGLLALELDGSFVYQPNGEFVGVDQFHYQVDDGLGEVDAAVVTILVRDVDSPVQITVEDDYYSFDGPSLLVATPGVLENDSVNTGDALSASVVVAPSVGTLVLQPDGGFSYQAPDGYSGVTGFSYAASAGGSSELAWVTLDVRQVGNVPPVAVGEHFGVLEDHLLSSSSAGNLLANDYDFEGAPLTLDLVTSTTHGVLDVRSDGEFTYQPYPDYNGSDQFSYRVFDGELYSNVAVAQITVFPQNDPPVALDDHYQTPIDTSLQVIAEQGLLSNDYDVDGDELIVELVDAPVHGQVQVAQDGAFVYHPAPGFSGLDTFLYAASDGLARAVARVHIQVVAPGNQPPVAQDAWFEIDEDTLLSSDDVGPLTQYASDPDGDTLSFALASAPLHGQLTMASNGEFSYLPHQDYFGDDSFAFTVSDGEFVTEPVTAHIVIHPVNDPPVARPDLYTVVQNELLLVDAAHGVLANDTDVEGDTLSAELASVAAHGLVSLATDGSFSYQPNAAFVGRDEFTYRVSDGQDDAIGRVAIDVTQAANQRPIAHGEVYIIAEDTVLDTRGIDSLLANDYDPDGDPISLEILALPAVGELEVLEDGHIRYVPLRDFFGTVYIDYQVTDGELSSLPVQAEIILTPVDDPPQAQPDLYLVPESVSSLLVGATDGVLANDHDPDGDTLIAELVSGPERGDLVLSLDGSFVYTPWLPRADMDHFHYRAVDPTGLHDQARVDLVLQGQLVEDLLFRSSFEDVTP